MLLEHGAHLIGNLVTLAAEVAEVELVERDRAHRHQLFAFQGTQAIAWRACVERLELGTDRVQCPNGFAVVVLIVTHDHSLGDTIQGPRAHSDRCNLLSHRHSSPLFTRSVVRLYLSCYGTSWLTVPL